MKYLSVAEIAKKWNISERSVRNYCFENRIPGAFMTGRTWNIPENAQKPLHKKTKSARTILKVLKEEKKNQVSGGLYHKIQIDLTYNSNHIEGSRLTHDQTRYIFETNTIGMKDTIVNVDDIIETSNHFRCIDEIIDSAEKPLSEKWIKKLHSILKTGTSDSRKDWFAVGNYKKFGNEVGGKETVPPQQVSEKMQNLLKHYHQLETVSFVDILDFHVRFERIHPFQDGNGRVGRLILFKECLKHNMIPFIITDEIKLFYYRGLEQWDIENGCLLDTCLTAQDYFKKVLDYFGVEYTEN